MKDVNKYLLCMKPVNTYEAPKIPTLEETRDNPELLKKLPSRWQKNAAVIVSIGLMGAITLSGCALGDAPTYTMPPTGDVPYYTPPAYTVSPAYTYPPNTTSEAQREVLANIRARLETAELELRTHHGGSGPGPFYVIHITEQEMLGFIRAYLEAAGLNLSATPPEYNVDDPWDGNSSIGLDLYDSERSVAIAYLDWQAGKKTTNEVVEAFAQQTNRISVGVFYRPGLGHDRDWWGWTQNEHGEYEPLPYEVKEEKAREAFIENLTNQVNTFVAWLQAEGIV